MSTQHKDIPNADLHEPKGVSSATVNTLYVADGSGSGSWIIPEPKGVAAAAENKSYLSDGAGSGAWHYSVPHGSVYYIDLTTGRTLTTPTSYTKVDPTTIASGSGIEFTEATTARLTYTGTKARHICLQGNITISQTIGAARTQTVGIYKSGILIASSEAASSVSSADKANISFQADTTCVTNDYFEVYVKTSGTGNIIVYTLNFYAQALL